MSTVYRCTRLVADVVQVCKACGSDLLSTVYRCMRRVHCVQVYETCGLTSSLLSTVYAAVPERNVTSEGSFLVDIEFTSEVRQTHSHNAVGSGKRSQMLCLCPM